MSSTLSTLLEVPETMKYCLTIRYDIELPDDIAARFWAKAKLILVTGHSISETNAVDTKIKLQEIPGDSAPRHVKLECGPNT